MEFFCLPNYLPSYVRTCLPTYLLHTLLANMPTYLSLCLPTKPTLQAALRSYFPPSTVTHQPSYLEKGWCQALGYRLQAIRKIWVSVEYEYWSESECKLHQ